MTTLDDRRPSVTGFYPPLPTMAELTVAGLSSDGQHVVGWVKVPSGPWTPDDGDLLWRPPNAVKSTDIDLAGSIVDVVLDPGHQMAWLTGQLGKRQRYLDALRDAVRAGRCTLTAALAGLLGLDFGDGAQLVDRTAATVSASGSVTALRRERQRFLDRLDPSL